MGMGLGREGQLQVNNCHEYFVQLGQSLTLKLVLTPTHPPTAMEVDRLCNLGNLSSRGVDGRVVTTFTLMAPEKAEKYEKKTGEFWDMFYYIHQNRFFKARNCVRTCTFCVSHWYEKLVPLASTNSVCPELSEPEGISCLNFIPKHCCHFSVQLGC